MYSWTEGALALCTLALFGCASTEQSSRVVGAERVYLGRRQGEITGFTVRGEAEGDSVVLRIASTRACVELEREDQRIEERTTRGPSFGAIIPGGILAAWGLSLLADPGESCSEEQYCVYDEKSANETYGTVLLLGGAVLVAGGFATIMNRSFQRTEPGRVTERRIPSCGDTPAGNVDVMLELGDGTRLVGFSDATGVVRLRVTEQAWSNSHDVLNARVMVAGRDAGSVRVRRTAEE